MKSCRVCGSNDMAARSALCKEHRREWGRQEYQKNKKYYVDKATKRTSEIKQWINEQKSVPCTDCLQQFPSEYMEFDHLKDKEFNIARGLLNGNIEKLKKEIAKCEVVCVFCHRHRTVHRKIHKLVLPNKYPDEFSVFVPFKECKLCNAHIA